MGCMRLFYTPFLGYLHEQEDHERDDYERYQSPQEVPVKEFLARVWDIIERVYEIHSTRGNADYWQYSSLCPDSP